MSGAETGNMRRLEAIVAELVLGILASTIVSAPNATVGGIATGPGSLADGLAGVRSSQAKGHTAVGVELPHQRDQVECDACVDIGRGLVCDDERGLGREGARNRHALPHAPAELVRIGPDAVLGLGNPDAVQQLDGARHGGLAGEPG